MSHAAIAAAIALRPASTGERLTALSLASFANREHRSWPGAQIAAARAGLSRSQYLACRDTLERRGLLRVDGCALGRGQSQPVTLLFAAAGPWCDQELNPVLLETVLSHSRSRGSVRVLLATIAALADEAGRADGMSTEALCHLAGVTDRTYRRARVALLASGELIVTETGGGRGRTNTLAPARPPVSQPGRCHPASQATDPAGLSQTTGRRRPQRDRHRGRDSPAERSTPAGRCR